MTQTDDNGHFAVSATDGYDRVRVRISVPEHTDQAFDLVPLRLRQDLTMPGSATLALTAFGHQGQPAPHAVATLWRRNDYQSWSVLDTANADAGGRITFEHAPRAVALQVIIEDTLQDRTVAWCAVAIKPIEGDAHDAGVITAEPTAGISGQLVALGTLRLDQWPALVLHRMSTGNHVTVRPSDDGTFAFPPMPAGEAYAITYHGPGHLHPAHAATIQAFAIGCTAVGGTLRGDSHLRLMIEPTWDGGPTPEFVGQDWDRPLTSISEARQPR